MHHTGITFSDFVITSIIYFY